MLQVAKQNEIDNVKAAAHRDMERELDGEREAHQDQNEKLRNKIRRLQDQLEKEQRNRLRDREIQLRQEAFYAGQIASLGLAAVEGHM